MVSKKEGKAVNSWRSPDISGEPAYDEIDALAHFVREIHWLARPHKDERAPNIFAALKISF